MMKVFKVTSDACHPVIFEQYGEALSYAADLEECGYVAVIDSLEMTQGQYDALKEFEGV